MVDYTLFNNDEEIPGEGILLKKARAKSKGGTLTDNVQPGQSVLPNARAAIGQPMDYRQRAADLYAQGEDMYQKYLDKNEGAGESATLNALAAQFAGEGFQPLQAQFLKKAGAAEDTQAKKAEFLLQQAKAYETLAQNAETARERIAAQREAASLQNQLKLMGLDIQRQGLDLRAQTAQLARAQHDQATADRKDKLLGEGTANLSKRADEYVNLVSGVRELNNRLSQYVPQGKSIPGVGYGSDVGALGVDVSGLMMGEEGKANRSMVKNVANELLRAASGQAVTLNEYERQTLSNMASGRFSEKDFLNAYENVILPKVNEAVSNIGGGFSQEVKDRYRTQGGRVDFNNPFVAPTRAKPQAGPSNNLSSQEQAELDALRKRFGGK
jgi:hypothetical protein